MRVAVVGTGYVGLVVGCGLADSGNQVICVDVDENKIAALRRGVLPIYEPGLDVLLDRNTRDGRLTFTTDLAEGVRAAEILFVAVGTPPTEDGSADVHHVVAVAEGIARALDGYRLIVIKSTVPIGTGDRVREIVASLSPHAVDVASNPEFLKEGAAVEDFMKPDRIILGVGSDRARRLLEDLYLPFTRTGCPVLVMDVRSAEMAKYAANAMLATRISFMNELSGLCERVGADIHHVRLGVGADPRIGPHFLYPGVGYGGSCFPKDVRALIGTGRGVGLELDLLGAVHRVNERQKRVLIDKIATHFGPSLDGLRFALWGLTFKPHTDDIREAPALVMLDALLAREADVCAYDPVAGPAVQALYGDTVAFADNAYEALAGADALLVVTEWPQFRMPDFERMRRLMRQPVIFDGRNLYDPNKLRALGFTYQAIGRP